MSGPDPQRHQILVCIPFPDHGLDAVRGDGFEVIYAPSASALAEVFAADPRGIEAIVTNGATGLDAKAFARLPGLRIVLTQGAGFEGVDLKAARRRNVTIATGGGANAVSVAQHGFALLLALLRGIPAADAAVRRYGWHAARKLRPLPAACRLGILGLGHIGRLVADYGTAFGMTVAYHGRSQCADVPYTYYPCPQALAAAADILMIACPGGAETRHIVDGPVLEALGARGYLVNISRGTVVLTDALAEALETGLIAGAALDVVEGEPRVPERLLAAPNLILTPHVAGSSPEAITAKIERIRENLGRFFAGAEVLSRIA